MTLKDLLIPASGGLVVLLTLVQIAPVKVNPWSALARWLGRAINAEVLSELKAVKADVSDTKARLDAHIKLDNERDADRHRERILQFNTELLRGLRHTREDFIEILLVIDYYNRYCRENPNYPNARAVHAIANIGRVYDARMEKHDFLKE